MCLFSTEFLEYYDNRYKEKNEEHWLASELEMIIWENHLPIIYIMSPIQPYEETYASWSILDLYCAGRMKEWDI